MLLLMNCMRVSTSRGVTSNIPMNKYVVPADADDFIKNAICKMIANEGDDVPVSQLPVDGTYPTGTAKYEKRNIALQSPVWEPDICIQCGICSFVCPHATIRMKIYDATYLNDAPPTFKYTDAKGKEYSGMKFTIQVDVEDCTGCGACVFNCPAKSKSDPEKKAINMMPQPPLREEESKNFAYFLSLPELPVDKYNKETVKGSNLHHIF